MPSAFCFYILDVWIPPSDASINATVLKLLLCLLSFLQTKQQLVQHLEPLLIHSLKTGPCWIVTLSAVLAITVTTRTSLWFLQQPLQLQLLQLDLHLSHMVILVVICQKQGQARSPSFLHVYLNETIRNYVVMYFLWYCIVSMSCVNQ